MVDYENFYFKMSLKTDPVIDDTTLRDGVQMPGLAISPEDVVKVALLLDEIGVERMELHHFQESDKRAARMIMELGLKSRIAGWCRAVTQDVDNAVDCGFKEVGISHPVSKIHFAAKWPDKSEEELLERVVDVVEYARDYGLRVFVHGEDSTRADWDFERKFINSVANAGAECYRICDTVGIGLSDPEAPLPNGIPAKVRAIKAETRIGAIEIHAHDDFGNSVENTMAAVRAASGLWEKIYVSTTLLGIGERAGNAETEKVIMNLYLHYGVEKFKGKTQKLKELADYFSNISGYTLPPNKAIVGDYAFAHESGIHTHGVLNNPLTYEPYPPELVGNRRRLTIGKHSGKAIVRHKIKELVGREPGEEQLAYVMRVIKDMYDRGRKASLKEDEFKRIVKEAGIL